MRARDRFALDAIGARIWAIRADRRTLGSPWATTANSAPRGC